MVVKLEKGLNPSDGVRSFLKKLLHGGMADAVLVACVSPHSRLPMPTLVTDKAMLDRAAPLAPVSPFNTARMASRVLADAVGKRIAVVMRPCEVRALIELEKLSQCTLEPAIMISMDCFGRMENDDYLEWKARSGEVVEHGYPVSSKDGSALCASCRACTRFVPESVDVVLALAGEPDRAGVLLASGSPRGEALLESLAGPSAEVPESRGEALARIMAERQGGLEEMTGAAALRIGDMAAFQKTIANCLNCYNCRTACPVCYCKECVFLTDVFAHRPEILIGRAAKKGAVKIPTDTTMFHLTRMAHMAHACVGCGQCSSVCPSHIPVADLFITVGQKVQDHYGYVPGQDPGRPWPFLVREDDNHEA
jgi:formate dehydrogenase (coenzyme F420) beta subunit